MSIKLLTTLPKGSVFYGRKTHIRKPKSIKKTELEANSV